MTSVATKNAQKFSNFLKTWVLFLTVATFMSACGKSMHVKLPKASGAESAGQKDVSATDQPNENNGVDNTLKTGAGAGAGENEVVVDTNSNLNSSSENSATPGKSIADQIEKMGPISVWDKTTSVIAGGLPYLNEAPVGQGVRNLGHPVFNVKDDSAGFVKRTNVLFRSVLHVPAKEQVKEVIAFDLILNGVRKVRAQGDDSLTLSNQMLCLLTPKRVCSGEKNELTEESRKNIDGRFFEIAEMKNNIFSLLPLEKVLFNLEDGSQLLGSEQIKVSMSKLFGFKLQDSIKWIEENSTVYSTNGYRKFTFVLANETYIQSGEVVLQVQTLPGSASPEKPDTLVNGPSDAIEATFEDESQNAVGGNVPEEGSSENASTGVSTSEETTVVTNGSSSEPNSNSSANNSTANSSADNSADNSTDHASGNGSDNDSGSASGNNSNSVLNSEEPVATDTHASSSETSGASSNQNPSLTPEAQVVANESGSVSLPSNPPQNQGDVNINLTAQYLTFDTNSSNVSEKFKNKLKQTARLLIINNGVVKEVRILGRADKAGTKEYNQALSEKRAAAVKGIFETENFSANKLKIQGLGEPDVSSCKTERCKIDRRVDVEIDLVDILLNEERNRLVLTIKAALNSIWNGDVAAGQNEIPASVLLKQ